ncbi:vegetative cell wall protein gp1-like, partial [Miscanthus floridulus]|uniref:vegetative cell wall protein gp1-like n=1 Tax=Miscanthus floridulus TaxID=154761 RepID=UPI00345B1ECB
PAPSVRYPAAASSLRAPLPLAARPPQPRAPPAAPQRRAPPQAPASRAPTGPAGALPQPKTASRPPQPRAPPRSPRSAARRRSPRAVRPSRPRRRAPAARDGVAPPQAPAPRDPLRPRRRAPVARDDGAAPPTRPYPCALGPSGRCAPSPAPRQAAWPLSVHLSCGAQPLALVREQRRRR